jgi:hypothetical protein
VRTALALAARKEIIVPSPPPGFPVHRSQPQFLNDSRFANLKDPVFFFWAFLNSVELREILSAAITETGFGNVQIDPNSDFATGSLQNPGPRGPLNLPTGRRVRIAWGSAQSDPNQTYIEWVVLDDARKPNLFPDEDMACEFGRNLWTRIQQVISERALRPAKIVLGPGESIPDSGAQKLVGFDPNLFLDYSGFALPEEAGLLGQGTIPLGRYVIFQRSGANVFSPMNYVVGPMLYASEGAQKHSVILVHGVSQSGKTTFTKNAICEANAAGYNILALDPYGDLIQAVKDRLLGNVKPVSVLGSLACLPRSGGSAGDTLDVAQGAIERTVDLLLSREDLRLSDPVLLGQSRDWLKAIAVLLHLKGSLASGQTGFKDLYLNVSDEGRLVSLIEEVEKSAAEKQDPVLETTVSLSASRLATLIAPGARKPEWARRDASVPFGYSTSIMIRALQPFLYSGVAAQTAYLEDLNDRHQVAILAEAPPNNESTQTTATALLQARLSRIFAIRRQTKGLRPLLVVVDSLEALPGFDALGLIKDAKGTSTTFLLTTALLTPAIYGRAEVQVYLSPDFENAAGVLKEQLGTRTRQIIARDVRAAHGRGVSISSQPNSEYFGKRELGQLPGARQPAIVYVPGLRRHKPPILVELDSAARVVVVTRNGGISEALKGAPPNTRVLIKPGVYGERLYIGQSIEVVADGAPGAVKVEVSNWPCLTVGDGIVTIRGVGFHSDTPVAIQVQGGSLRLIGCSIHGNIEATGRELILNNCELMDCELFIDRNSVTVEDCRIVSRSLDGILQVGGDVVIRRTEIREARKACVEIAGGTLLLEDCVLSHARFGMVVSGTRPVLRRCVIQDIGESAVWLNQGGSVDSDRSVEERSESNRKA